MTPEEAAGIIFLLICGALIGATFTIVIQIAWNVLL